MSTIPTSTVIQAIVVLLTEVYAGPPNPTETWFIDNEPDSGILGILSSVNADEASRSADGSGKTGTSIASHVEHLRWSLANVNATMRGEAWNPAWSESWKLIHANPEGWEQLRSSLRSEFETLRQALQKQNELPGEYLLGVVALLPHAAYHLGNIRQMVERVRS
jgi:hypothetical protein